MAKDKDYLFKIISKRIADTDFSGYTFQYPPLFSWKAKDAESKVGDAWEKALSVKNNHLGIYVHVPFCKQRCTYCRYFSEELNDQGELDRYLNLLKKETNLLKKYFKNQKIHSLYIGGGTPAILDLDQLKKLFDHLYDSFDLSVCKQTVFEGNPDFLSLTKLRLLKKYKVNRLTIGVQSLDQKVINLVNRFQTSGSFQKCIKNARKVGIESINIDLMVGLPQQDSSSFLKTLEEVISLGPDMIHLHPFYPTNLTIFSKENKKVTQPEIIKREKMSHVGQLILQKNGYKENEFDANSKSKADVNIQLADAMEYNSSFLGLGPGAVSHVAGRLRYVNANSIAGYEKSLNDNSLPVLSMCELNSKDDMIYFVISCLRYGKVDKKKFKKIFNKNIDDIFSKEIAYLARREKLENTEDFLLPKFSDLGDYSILSKYFYDKKFIAYCEKEFSVEKIKEDGELYF